MKKILIIAVLLFSVVAYGQKDSALDKIVEISEKVQTAKTPEERAVFIEELKSVLETTDSKVVKGAGTKLLKALEELSAQESLMVQAKKLNEVDKKLSRGLLKKKDKFKGLTFIKSQWRGEIYPYICLSDEGTMCLRFVTMYRGKDWVFYDKVIVLCDGEKIEFAVEDTDRKVNSSAGVSERADNLADKKMIELLRKIAKAESVELRFSGKYVADRKLKRTYKKNIKKVLDLYDALKK